MLAALPTFRLRLIALFLLSLSLCAPRAAAEPAAGLATWTGTVSSAWHDPLNWNPLLAPDGMSSVVIPAGTPFAPQISAAPVSIASLNVNTNASLQIWSQPVAISGDMQVTGTVTSMVSGALFEVGGNFTVSGNTAFLNNPGLTQLTGNGDITVNGNAGVTPLRVVSGFHGLNTSVVPELHLIGGEIHVKNAVLFTVSQLLRLEGGVLSFDTSSSPFDTLHVDGDVEVVATTAGSTTTQSRFVVGGNWTGESSFIMTQGLIDFVTSGTSTINGNAPYFGNVRIASNQVVLNAITHINGNLEVNPNGKLDVNTMDLVIAGDFINSSGVGGVLGTQPITLAGDGLLQVNVTTQPNIVNGSGVRNVTTSTVNRMTQNGGTLHIVNGALLTIQEDLRLNAGTLSFDTSASSLDSIVVQGDFVQNGAQVGSTTGSTRMYVDGNWTANAPFVLDNGWVYLQGANPQIGGTMPMFRLLQLQGGPVTLLQDVDILGTLKVNSGGTIGNGYMNLRGTVDTVIGSNNVMHRLRCLEGANSISTSVVDELEIVGGSLTIVNGALLRVTTEARLSGGTLNWDTSASSLDTLDIDGDLLVTGTAVGTTTPSTRLRVQGNWTTETPFVLANGWVELDGDGSSVAGAAREFRRLNLVSGDRVLTDDIQITGTITRAGGTVSGPGYVELLGSTGEPITLSGFLVPLMRVVSGSIPMSTVQVGELEVIGGEMNVLNGTLISVATEARLIGGTINWDTSSSSLDTIDVAGDLVITGTQVGTTSGSTRLRIAGDSTWNAPFELPSGWLVFHGGNATVQGSDVDFQRIQFESGDIALPADIRIKGTATRSAGTISGSGYLDFVGSSSEPVSLSGITLPFVRVSGPGVIMSTLVADQFELTDGSLSIPNGVLIQVVTEARLSGGNLAFDTSSGTLDTFEVLGNLIETGTVVNQASTSTRLTLHGDYESDSGMTVEPGIVTFIGSNHAVRGLNPVFHNLVLSGATVALESTAQVTGNLTVNSGTLQGPEWLEVIGATGTVTTSSSLVEKLRIVAGDHTVSTSRIGELELTGGSMHLPNGALVIVEQVARLIGGELTFDTSSGTLDTLDVNGDVEHIGTVCSQSSTSSRFHCAGDWSSNGTLGMSSGEVILYGVGTTTIQGSFPGFNPGFPTLRIANGTRQVVNGPDISAASTIVNANGTLQIGKQRTDWIGGPMTVSGTLDVEPGGVLVTDASSSILIQPGANLELLGAPGNPATLEGANNDLDLTVRGQLIARDFVVREPIASGVLIDTTATFAAAPNDMRGGVFARPDAAPGSTLLDLRPFAAATFQFVRFDDPLGVGTYNVTRTAGSPVAFQNFGGNLSGDLFENDPNGTLIDWLPSSSTQLVGFTAKPGPEQVMLAFETSVEVNVAMFRLQAASDPLGPFVTIANLAPLGVGQYAFTEANLPPNQARYYRLLEEQTSSFQLVLADASATPYSAATPANIRTVGPGGEFATIQAAVNAVTHSKSVIRVAPGTYSSFTVNAPGVGSLHLIADGAVTIDASAAPVVISNVGAGKMVELKGFAVNGGALGIDAFANAGLLVLDSLDVNAVGVGAQLDQTAFANLQRSNFVGAPGLRVGAGTKAYAGRGSATGLDVQAGARWETCQFAATGAVLDPGATVVDQPGIMPDLSIGAFQSLCQSFNVQIEAAPSSFYQLGVSGIAAPLDLGNPAVWQMLPILNVATYQVMSQGFVPPGGQVNMAFELPPNPAFLGNRFLAQAWSVSLSPGLTVRFSNLATVIGMP